VAAGRELKVETVLEGSVQRIGDRVRVTARLVRVEDGAPLWAGTFNEKFTDIFAVQDSISERVAVTLAVELVGRERELLAKSHTRNAEAYRAYLIGRYFWNQRTEEGLKKSIEHFHRAIEADPQYALAYAGLADSHGALLVWSSVSPDEDFAKAKAAALKALEIDNSLAEVHAVLGTIKMYYEWDWPGAEKSCRRAIEMNPNNAAAHQRYAEYLVATGRFDEAVAEFRAGQQLDPLSLIMHTQEGATLYFARRYDEAIEKLRKTLEMDQNFMLAHVFLGVVFEAKGMYEEAISEFQKAGVASGGSLEEDARVAAAMRAAYVNAGERGYWRWWIDRYTERAKGRPIHNYNRARYYARLGENDQAYAWLDKAYQHKEAQLVTLKVDPAIDGIRSDPRYTDLLRRIRLGP
jgi:tetratricopeptide (TPR) repeat protein